VASSQAGDEIKRLQCCINDLISVQAFAAIWTSQELAHSVGTLLDLLVCMLRLN